MITGILGKKVGMTQLFDARGDVRPITVLQAGPCVVTQKKSAAKEGYDAIQIGLVEFVKGTHVNKAMAGHFGKNNVPPVKFMREVALQTVDALMKLDLPAGVDVEIKAFGKEGTR